MLHEPNSPINFQGALIIERGGSTVVQDRSQIFSGIGGKAKSLEPRINTHVVVAPKNQKHGQRFSMPGPGIVRKNMDFLPRVERVVRAWLRRDFDRLPELLSDDFTSRWSGRTGTQIFSRKSLSVENLAFALEDGLSETTLRRKLQELGATESPGELIYRLRMEYAAELLQQRSLSIPAVGELAGFDDRRFFASRFKQFHKLTPRAYRSMFSPVCKIPVRKEESALE